MAVSLREIVKIVLGNIMMFVCFGFLLGRIFTRFKDLKSRLLAFIPAITIVEGLQYVAGIEIFEADDIILIPVG